MFSPKNIQPRDKTPFLVRSRTEGLEPRIFLDDPSDDTSDDPSDDPSNDPSGEAKDSAPPEDIRATKDLLVKGLMDRLPKPNSTWSLDDRTRWLQTAASIFGLIYETDDAEQREIAIALDGTASRSK